ncbi:MAG: hypothetical protein ACRDL7_04295, partial [Gaiellaceae bacterium]
WRNLKNRADQLGEPLPTDWGAFKRALRAEFQPVSLERIARVKLDTARQTASVADFVTELRKLKWNIPDLSDSELRFRFEKGLAGAAIADAITARPELPIEEAFQLAITIDANRELRKEAYRKGTSSGSRVEVNAMEEASADARQCYNCGEIGHIARGCPNPAKGGAFKRSRGRGGPYRGRGQGRGRGRSNGRGNAPGQSA